jgi:SAM-dependent methyltransferase
VSGTALPAAPRDEPFRQAAEVIRHVQKTEHRYLLHGERYDERVTPWMPFQPAEFLSILFECVPELAGRNFLDVGCGPGTKMLLAGHFYGLHAEGIEIDSAMAAAAAAHGGVFPQDALEAVPCFYSVYDLIWLYRPFRDRELEQQLERRIMNEMKPGAVLAGGGWEICPADQRWITVVDDWELRRGAWLKPRPVTDLAEL